MTSGFYQYSKIQKSQQFPNKNKTTLILIFNYNSQFCQLSQLHHLYHLFFHVGISVSFHLLAYRILTIVNIYSNKVPDFLQYLSPSNLKGKLMVSILYLFLKCIKNLLNSDKNLIPIFLCFIRNDKNYPLYSCISSIRLKLPCTSLIISQVLNINDTEKIY